MPITGRMCLTCGTSIDNRAWNAVYCKPCMEKQKQINKLTFFLNRAEKKAEFFKNKKPEIARYYEEKVAAFKIALSKIIPNIEQSPIKTSLNKDVSDIEKPDEKATIILPAEHSKEALDKSSSVIEKPIIKQPDIKLPEEKEKKKRKRFKIGFFR